MSFKPTADSCPAPSQAATRRAQGLLPRLVSYLHECLRAETNWARALNVLDGRELTLLPLMRDQQQQLGHDQSLVLTSSPAIEMANRFAAAGPAAAVVLGALFLVGRTPGGDSKPSRRICAPLLEVPLTLRRDLAGGRVIVEPEDDRFSVNYGLVAELLGASHDDLHDRLTDLAQLVPDFPIDPAEFGEFWTGFRMVAPGLPLADELPRPRRTGSQAQAATPRKPLERKSPCAPVTTGRSRGQSHPNDAAGRLEIVDFYTPAIAHDERFRLLPATAIMLANQSGHELAVLEDLEAMARLPLGDTALAGLVDLAPPQAAAGRMPPERAPDDAFPLPLSAAQEAVVRSARSAALTVVTGPPGTGKSYTIAAIVIDCLLRGETVLVASQMDKAVEVVANKVASVAGPYTMARSGGRSAQRELANQIGRLTGPKSAIRQANSSGADDRAGRHQELGCRVAALERRLRRSVELERAWSDGHMAHRRLAPACPLPVHPVSARAFRRALRAAGRARQSLQGQSGWLGQWWGRYQVRRALRLLRARGVRDCSLDELDELLSIQGHLQRMREAERQAAAPFAADSLWEEIDRAEQSRSREALMLLTEHRHSALAGVVSDPRLRRQLRDLSRLLRRRNRKVKRSLREQIDPGLLLRAFPAWASTNRTVGQVLPMQPGLVDLVVIDEASQCDLATAAVALARARRAVIVGDPNQLRHVCFLGRAREQAAFARHGLPEDVRESYSYSRRSLFDVAADAVRQDGFFLLDEHFRSHPHIIGFSNRHFYDEQLRIMTDRPCREPTRAIRVERVDGRRMAGTTVNPAEVEAVLREMTAIVESAAAVAPSIGVVCPFREQVDAILDLVGRRLPAAAIERHALVVGTAHSLQGDEKDVVILATSIDRGFHSASLRFLESPNLFNVAVTRARQQLVVVTSVGPDDLPPGLLREYLLHAQGAAPAHSRSDDCEHPFAEQAAAALAQRGLEVWPGFAAAGFAIDLVVTRDQRHLALFCDGAGSSGPADDPLAQHRILSRAGWAVRRISHRQWHADWYACAEYVEQCLRDT